MSEMTPLCELAKKYETDKGGKHCRYGGQPNDGTHGYTPIYWNAFGPDRASVENVFEIGINCGASLRMWEEFFPNATIVGVDCDTNYLINAGRIKSYWADQGQPATLVAAMNKAGLGLYDLIMDDGSHHLGHQIGSMKALLPFLSLGGVYVIEEPAYVHAIIEAVPSGFTAEVKLSRAEDGAGKYAVSEPLIFISVED